MAEFHLDTNTCSAAMAGDANVQSNCLRFFGQLRVSTIVVAELYTGAYHSQRVNENIVALEDFLSGIEVVPFDEEAARVCGLICTDLLLRGLPTGEKDAMIAAVAKSRNAILVTHNTRHFQNIAGLQLEDWTQ